MADTVSYDESSAMEANERVIVWLHQTHHFLFQCVPILLACSFASYSLVNLKREDAINYISTKCIKYDCIKSKSIKRTERHHTGCFSMEITITKSEQESSFIKYKMVGTFSLLHSNWKYLQHEEKYSYIFSFFEVKYRFTA